jgi:hypothetical protein
MAKNPTWLDRLMARLLSGQLPVIALLVGLAASGLLLARGWQADPYLQACAVEVSVGSVFFLVLYIFRIEKFTPRVAMTFLILGGAFGVAGWMFSQQHRLPLVSAYLLELASASILFIVVELLLRGILQAAEQRTIALANVVQKIREQAVADAKKAAADRVNSIRDALEARRTGQWDENDSPDPWTSPWDPQIPAQMWTVDDDGAAWSFSGLGGRRFATAEEMNE